MLCVFDSVNICTIDPYTVLHSLGPSRRERVADAMKPNICPVKFIKIRVE